MLGLQFLVDPSNVDETLRADCDAGTLVVELATLKARAAVSRHQDALIIAADTLVEIDGQILGKPRDRHAAGSMLQLLSGRQHDVFTGLTLIDASSGREQGCQITTSVWFRELDGAEIEAYLDTAEPYDKAGAYGLQGLGAVFVQRIDGDWSNVIGLPLTALNQLLSAFGCCIICRHLYASTG